MRRNFNHNNSDKIQIISVTSFTVTNKCLYKLFFIHWFPDADNNIALSLSFVIHWSLEYSFYLSGQLGQK